MVISLFVIAAMPMKAAHFNHVGQYGVLRAVQFFHAFDGEQVGCDTADFGSHPVE